MCEMASHSLYGDKGIVVVRLVISLSIDDVISQTLSGLFTGLQGDRENVKSFSDGLVVNEALLAHFVK